MKNTIVNVTKYVLTALNQDKYVLAGLALTLFVLSSAFPASIHLGANTLVSALIAAVFVHISLIVAVPITFALFDYTKVGEYKLSLKQLSLKEKLFIATLTFGLGAIGLQVLSSLFSSVISLSSSMVAVLVIFACEIVALGIDRFEEVLKDRDDDEGMTRQGKRKPTQSKRKPSKPKGK
ncbi:MAG: hypothetical protein K2Y22_05915 [Candidatus Obscuribacterales bacterium]|nr:hypothetical protein [Candidatus Obscuribacterales bacterium]